MGEEHHFPPLLLNIKDSRPLCFPPEMAMTAAGTRLKHSPSPYRISPCKILKARLEDIKIILQYLESGCDHNKPLLTGRNSTDV